MVKDGGQEKMFLNYVAERVAADLGLPAEDLSEEAPLNDLVCRFRKQGGARQEVYPLIKEIAADTTLTVPEPLRNLARIRHFNLFVTTTFDSLLERALRDERPQQNVKSLTYAPQEWDDLPTDMKNLSEPVVYHLMGRASALPDYYVVTEEDALEFLYKLHDEDRRPRLLFDELKQNNLLIIGSNFPDWLARFFIRVAKGARLSGHQEQMVLADRRAGVDNSLIIFLEHFTNRTTIFHPGGADDFVNELYQRYMENNLAAQLPAAQPAPSSQASAPLIFLSYDHRDMAIVENIFQALTQIGWNVWFDKRELNIGDTWDPKILDNINECRLFLPVVSAHTQQRGEAYFRKEWGQAADRFHRFARTEKFLLPILIDEKIDHDDAIVPDEFKKVQWSTLRGGAVTAEFRNEMQELLREQRKREKNRV